MEDAVQVQVVGESFARPGLCDPDKVVILERDGGAGGGELSGADFSHDGEVSVPPPVRERLFNNLNIRTLFDKAWLVFQVLVKVMFQS